MRNALIPKPIMILFGIGALVVGIIVGVREILYWVDRFNYGFPYSTEFTESFQEIALTVVNFYQFISGIMGALAFIVPIWAGRKLYRTGYALSDEETVPKAYRAGGINLIVAGGLAIAVYAWIFTSYNFSSYEIVYPIILAAIGVTGLVGSITTKA